MLQVEPDVSSTERVHHSDDEWLQSARAFVVGTAVSLTSDGFVRIVSVRKSSIKTIFKDFFQQIQVNSSTALSCLYEMRKVET